MKKNLGMTKYCGLSLSEVEDSRLKYGRNILTPPKKTPLWKRFLDKFKDPLIMVLLTAGILSVGISAYEFTVLSKPVQVFFEPTGIFAAILLATGLAFIFEVKAEKEFEILNMVNDDEPVQVIREGQACKIPKKNVVVGDLVVLNTGDEIPADGQLVESVSLEVDESSLTGEPVAHKSHCEEEFDHDATFPSNHVLRGTKVMEGHAVMEVFAVGDHTENGNVFSASQMDVSGKTPLGEQLDKLGKFITIASYAIGVLIIVIRITAYFMNFNFEWLKFTAYFLQTIMIAVTLIVVAVPEGLPMAVTLSLAYSMRRMLKTNNLVRKMHACETMGATTVICTDKTGTLTKNRMSVEDMFIAADTDPYLFDIGIAANSTAELHSEGSRVEVVGNPTEGALLLWLSHNGKDYKEIRSGITVENEIPFNTQRKYMASVAVDSNGKRILFLKGAPEIVRDLCDDSTSIKREELETVLRSYQTRAMRTLGFAIKELDTNEAAFGQSGIPEKRGLHFAGVAVISDPVREEVPEAVEEVSKAGIQVKMVTGDSPSTAKEIGRSIGLWKDVEDTDATMTTGPEMAAMTDVELDARVRNIKIVARAKPVDKKRIVESLRRNNEIVAVTGDGTNDAPAMKAAHVGLSMGDGTSVAKEASDITIVNNSFSSIVKAVMWGRSLYRNIQRFILFQLTVNVAACLTVLFGNMTGTQSPLTVTQMLWVNLIMDTFAAMALASLPPNQSVMLDKPRNRGAFIITKPMWKQICSTGIFFFIILYGLLILLSTTNISTATRIVELSWVSHHDLNAYELSLFFTTFVFLQFWNIFNARAFATGKSAFDLKGCNGFVVIAIVILVGQIGIVCFGGEFFNVVPLTINDWIIIIASTSIVLWTGEAFRFIRKSRLRH